MALKEKWKKVIVGDLCETMLKKHNIYLSGMGGVEIRLVCHLHIEKEHCEFMVDCLAKYFGRLVALLKGLVTE